MFDHGTSYFCTYYVNLVSLIIFQFHIQFVTMKSHVINVSAASSTVTVLLI